MDSLSKKLSVEFLRLAAVLVFRRRAIRIFLERSGFSSLGFLLSVAVLLQFTFYPPWGRGFSVFHILLILLIVPLYSALWLLANVALIEPVLNFELRVAEEYAVELHWWNKNRMATRKACLVSLVLPLFIRGLILPFFGRNLLAEMIINALAISWAYLILTAVVMHGWDQTVTAAALIAVIPVLSAILFALAIYSLPLAAIISTLLIFPLFRNTGDLWLLARLNSEINRVFADQILDLVELDKFLEKYHDIGDGQVERELPKAVSLLSTAKMRSIPVDLKMRILSLGGKPLQAIDAGLAALEKGGANTRIHLALAEASLAVDDLENAAAHALEALDRAGSTSATAQGCEAMLLIAIASYDLDEMESSERISSRVFTFEHKHPDAKLKRILAEVKMLSRQFGPAIVEED